MTTKIYTMPQIVSRLGWRPEASAKVIIGRTFDYLHLEYTTPGGKYRDASFTMSDLIGILKCSNISLGHVKYYSRGQDRSDQVLVAEYKEESND